MGVIRRAGPAPAAIAGEGVRFDDFARRRELVHEAAEQTARKILEEAHAEAERVRAEAKRQGEQEGRGEGRADGLAEGREQGRIEALEAWGARLEALRDAWEGALGQLESARDAIVREAKDDLVQLAAEIARRATHDAIDADPARVAMGAVEALVEGAGARTRLIIRLHPDDARTAGEVWSDLAARLGASAHVELIEDGALEPGRCVATTAGGALLDESAATRIERIVGELLGKDAG